MRVKIPIKKIVNVSRNWERLKRKVSQNPSKTITKNKGRIIQNKVSKAFILLIYLTPAPLILCILLGEEI